MRKLTRDIAILSLLILCVQSCSKNHLEDTPRAAITTLSLGDFNVLYNDFTEDGRDTVKVRVVSSGQVEFDIDNVNNRIFNTDTLPYGSVLNQMTTNISVDGTAYYYIPDSLGEMHYFQWSSTLQIDLREPVTIFAVSTDGSYERKYTLTANVYKTFPDSMSWSRMSHALPAMQIANAVELDGDFYVFGSDGSGSPVFTCQKADADVEWPALRNCGGLSANAGLESLTLFAGGMALTDNGCLFTSSDGATWTGTGSRNDIERLIPFRQNGGAPQLWAVTSDGQIVCSEDGIDWTVVQELPADFPCNDVNGVCFPLESNRNIMTYIISGTSPEYDEALVWTKLSTEQEWSRTVAATDRSYSCPKFENMSMIRYDGRLYSFGGKAVRNGTAISPMQNFFESRDKGIAWKECDKIWESYDTWNNYMQIPDACKNGDAFVSAVDGDNVIWLISASGSGIWRGYINRLHN